MNHDQNFWYRSRFASLTGCGLAGVVSLLCLTSSMGKDPVTRLFLLSGSSLSVVSAKVLKRSSDQASELLGDIVTTSAINRQRAMLTTARPAEVKPKEEPYAPGLFDWQELTDRQKYPVVIISGKQGAGKTTTGEYLGALVGTGKRYAVSPHMKPSDFAAFDGKFGGGANYWQSDDIAVSWSDILKHQDVSWSIWQVLTAIEQEVIDRLKRYALGDTNYEPIDFYIDEVVAMQRYFKRKCPDRKLRDFVENFLSMALTEPRKVGIRFWVLTQAETVEALGLKGLAGLKDDSLFVRLNHASVRYARRMVRSRFIDPRVLDWLVNQNRPVMVDETPAQLPSIYEMRAVIEDFCEQRVNVFTDDEDGETSTPQDFYPTGETVYPSAKDEPNQLTPTSTGFPAFTAVYPENGSPKNTPYQPPSEASVKVLPTPKTSETLTAQEVNEFIRKVNWMSDVTDAGKLLPTFRSRTLELFGSTDSEGKKWTKSHIIQSLWGLRGKRYEFGKQLWQTLNLPES